MALPPPAPGAPVAITGASSGIGEALASEVASRGRDLALVARRGERLEELAGELRTRHGVAVEAHPADLADPVARLELAASLAPRIAGLCNNAGIAAIGPFLENADEDEAAVVALNVVALHDLTKLLAPAMVERGAGAVLNVSSIYAAAPVPNNATYAATKAFVSSFSEALHAELAGTGVSVTVCSPGPTRTEAFTAGGAEELLDVGAAALWQDPEHVARDAVDAMEAGRRTTTPGTTNRIAELSGRFVPRSVLLPLWKRFAP